MDKKPKVKESNVHQQVVDYLKIQYPGMIFRTDFSSGIRMTIGQAVKHKRLQHSRAFPDLAIYHPRAGSGSVLFIELKRSRDEVFKKNGGLLSNEHIIEQSFMLERLRELGYGAEWGLGFEHTRQLIDNWIKK